MKVLMIIGKALVLSFWLALGAALANQWLESPFEQLIELLAAFLLSLHALQLWLFSALLADRANPWLDRIQVLLFGIFHLYPLEAGKPADELFTVALEEIAHA